LLLENIHERAEELFREEGFQVERLRGALEGSDLARTVREGTSGSGAVHILGLRSASKATKELFESDSPSRLLSIGCFCIGTDQVELRSACLAGVPVFNSPFSNTRSVAELTICEIIALHRKLADKSAQMHKGEWDKSAAGAHEVRGRTLGIIGYGRIGSQVSVLAESLGMRVAYYDVAMVLGLGNARACRSMEEVLSQSDVVTLHVPDIPSTRGLIGRAQLAMMKPGTYLINNARGHVVELGALAEALKTGHIAGAALDVFPNEPKGSARDFSSDVRGLPNVILTPHVGGSTEEAQRAIAEDVATKLIRFVNNGTTSGAVNVPQVELPSQDAGYGGGESSRRHRILHFHRNVPGVLSKLHGEIAALGGNIAAEYLQTNADIGYVVLDVDPMDTSAVVERLRQAPETIRVRMLW
jgi:D-3-phosphoglycerate dehydrogenase